MAGVEVGQAERLADAARNDRDLQDVGVHRGNREKPDESGLEDAAIDVLADRDDVRVSTEAQVAGNGRPAPGQQFEVVGQARTRTLAPAQHTEAGGRFLARHASVADWTALIA